MKPPCPFPRSSLPRRGSLARKAHIFPHFPHHDLTLYLYQIIVVSGGTQGCGEAIAIACAEEGAAGVIICGRQEAKGAAVSAEIEARGAKALYVKVACPRPGLYRAVR
jgi:hypothetical protein